MEDAFHALKELTSCRDPSALEALDDIANTILSLPLEYDHRCFNLVGEGFVVTLTEKHITKLVELIVVLDKKRKSSRPARDIIQYFFKFACSVLVV